MTDDHVDDELLRSALGDRAGEPVDAASARSAVVARAGRVRTVRAVVAGGATAGLVVVGLAVLAGGGAAEGPVSTEPSLPPVASTTLVPSTTTAPSTDSPPTTIPQVTSVPATVAPPDTTDTMTTDAPVATSRDGDDSTGPVIGPTSPTESLPSAPTSIPSDDEEDDDADDDADDDDEDEDEDDEDDDDEGDDESPDDEADDQSTESDAADAPFTRQYDSTGGSITVGWDGTSLTLLAVAPRPGFGADISEQNTSRIDVDFESADDDSQIEIEADDGKVSVSIS